MTTSRLGPPRPRLDRALWLGLLAASLPLFGSGHLYGQEAAAEKKVEFIRDIQPILAEHCWHCHGVDESTRESGLRLDKLEGALNGGDSGNAAIEPGRPEKSYLMDRVRSPDPDVVMPPPSAKKPLTPAQIGLLARWIEQGAEYTTHWAFMPPVAPELKADGGEHPIDQLVQQQLEPRQLQLQPPAPPHQLCRRLYLDLIGLPPTPQELAEFDREGYLATVDKLLASERFGEKWGRHWLDVARYSDTNGYEKDMPRDQWIYRDWVISAFNADMPYNQFLIEQFAGDLLPNATQSQKIATGFLRNSMLNEEGAIVPEQFRMVEMFDRIDCVGKGVLGLTTQCAQCHSHKFDPLTQSEYYGMFAFLNNTYEALSWVYTPEQQAEIQDIHSGIEQADEQLRQQRPNWSTELQAWSDSVLKTQAAWSPLVMHQLESISGLNHPVQQADQSISMLGHTSNDVFFVSTPELTGATGLRLEVLTHGDLPQRGPGRNREGTWDVQELEAFVKRPEATDWEKIRLVEATTDFSEAEQSMQEGKQKSGPVNLLIDGNDGTWWQADRGRGRRNQPSVAVIQFEKPLDVPAGTQLKIAMRMGKMVGCCRLSVTRDAKPQAAPVDYAAVMAMQQPSDQRTDEQRRAIFAAWRKTLADQSDANGVIEQLWSRYPEPMTSVMHLMERDPGDRRTTYHLDRGNWDQPRQEVAPHTPAVLNPFPAGEPRNRLGFARWIASNDSPLTARVAVNRVWQAMFGEGLVLTPEDFGTRAPVPEHQDVLDWLAVDFMRHDWSHKHLIRTIVTSRVYQQDSRVTPEAYEQDPRNRWLARGPRFRADAEVVRDIALSAAGLLTNKMGGPSVIPPVPQNVLDYNYTYPSYWQPAAGAERYRRAVYGFRKRSMPDPVMSALDGPNGEIACPKRLRSNTPLAALTNLNEPIFIEAAQELALRVLREGGPTDADRAAYAFQLCTARVPTETERAEVLELLASRRQRLADGWLNARQISTGDPGRLPKLPDNSTPQDAAAWTLVARVLLNLDETISKN
ncbi:MAG: PSD1 and planctomycete cytochrome C domain-containing protein [Pirellulales bacterium]